MAQYINKDALVAEINRRIEEYRSMKIDSSYYDGMIASLEFLRDEFVNTFEVKEVDLPTWEPICSFQYFSDNDIFIEDNCLRWGNMVISLDELKKLPKKS